MRAISFGGLVLVHAPPDGAADSTSRGNTGPVTEALTEALDTDFTVATPAFPDNQRTVFKGHLFLGDKPTATLKVWGLD